MLLEPIGDGAEPTSVRRTFIGLSPKFNGGFKAHAATVRH